MDIEVALNSDSLIVDENDLNGSPSKTRPRSPVWNQATHTLDGMGNETINMFNSNNREGYEGSPEQKKALSDLIGLPISEAEAASTLRHSSPPKFNQNSKAKFYSSLVRDNAPVQETAREASTNDITSPIRVHTSNSTSDRMYESTSPKKKILGDILAAKNFSKENSALFGSPSKGGGVGSMRDGSLLYENESDDASDRQESPSPTKSPPKHSFSETLKSPTRIKKPFPTPILLPNINNISKTGKRNITLEMRQRSDASRSKEDLMFAHSRFNDGNSYIYSSKPQDTKESREKKAKKKKAKELLGSTLDEKSMNSSVSMTSSTDLLHDAKTHQYRQIKKKQSKNKDMSSSSTLNNTVALYASASTTTLDNNTMTINTKLQQSLRDTKDGDASMSIASSQVDSQGYSVDMNFPHSLSSQQHQYHKNNDDYSISTLDSDTGLSLVTAATGHSTQSYQGRGADNKYDLLGPRDKESKEIISGTYAHKQEHLMNKMGAQLIAQTHESMDDERDKRDAILYEADKAVANLPIRYLWSKPSLRSYAKLRIYQSVSKMTILKIHNTYVGKGKPVTSSAKTYLT